MNCMEYIDSFAKFRSNGGFKPGLQRVTTALELLGNPEKEIKIIHVAGTNGKGSTSAMISSVLKQADYQVGLYSSPHLQSFTERFRLNGKPINIEDLELVTEKIKPIIEEISRDSSLGRPSFFEMITILAFVYYAYKKVDALVLEVGLGGRLDATNVVHPLVSVITSIGFDHTEYLGTTLSQIAYEKAGIIKECTPVVIGVRDQDAIDAIIEQADLKKAPLSAPLSVTSWEKVNEDLHKQTVDLIIESDRYRQLEIGLVGDHQVRNAVVAIKTLKVIQEHFPKVNNSSIREGLKEVRWPGRLELVRENPPVLIDGAHNIEGIEALVDYLNRIHNEYQNLYLVMSILKDKDVKQMLERVVPLASGIVFTQNHNFRANTAEDLAKLLEDTQVDFKVISEFDEAIRYGISQASSDDLVCITGSLYTIAEAREILLPGEEVVT